jgi:hypothetical protein
VESPPNRRSGGLPRRTRIPSTFCPLNQVTQFTSFHTGKCGYFSADSNVLGASKGRQRYRPSKGA